MSKTTDWPRGEVVDHPTPGKAWVTVPHRNDIAGDWIEIDLPASFPEVRGYCPCCGAQSLFLGAGGYVTCSRQECSQPDAASMMLERSR